MNIENCYQNAIIDYLEYTPNCCVYRTQAGKIRTDQGRSFSTGKKGCPDITLCYKGRYVGLEVKTPSGRQSLAQKDFQREVEAAGGLYFLVTDVDQVINILKEIDKGEQ